MNEKEFKSRRLKALINLNVTELILLMKLQGKPLLIDKKEFWLTVHKVRLLCPGIPSHCKTYSKKWLQENEHEKFDEMEMAKWL